MPLKIRDYLYLDVNRLRSIYAQLSGGAIEQFIRSQITEEKQDSGIEKNGSQVNKGVLLGAGKVETLVLHDYLFTEVEQLIGDLLVDVTDTNLDEIKPGSYVRVRGLAEIDEPERLLNLVNSFNRFYGGTLLAGHAKQIQDQIVALEDELSTLNSGTDSARSSKRKGINDTDRKRETIEHKIRSLSPEALIRSLGIGIPEITKDMLELWIKLMYTDFFEIKIMPFDNLRVFRAIVHKQNLREDSSLVYAKYGSRTQVPLTLVGQVTTIYDAEYLGSESTKIQDVESYLEKHDVVEAEQENTASGEVSHSDQELMPSITANEQKQNIRDAIEDLFKSMYGIEKFLLVSGERKTWVITPLAIYNEQGK